ncbi:MAG: substrate-binding domain-containing protein [Spirochaetia bacterium]|nr:substrate-binding domain-containing protein [Spirochaetia bacterium]MCF7953600.1 substrate-binding domain-containing protein [Spirochaetales bacterium]
MKKALIVLLVLMCASTLVFAQGDGEAAAEAETVSGEAVKIGVTVPTADHGWTGGVVWWAEKAIKEWEARDPSIEFIMKTAADPASQVAVVEDLMVQEIDALVILPHDSAPLTPVVEEAHKAGIYTVVIDRGLTKSGISDAYIAGDNPGLGRVSAQWMAEELNGRGKIVALEGIPCVINTERVEAFEAVMDEYPGIEILDSQPAYWSTQKGLEIMENYLQKYDDIDAVFAQDDDVLKGVLQAYKESGRNDIDIFLGGAGSKDIIKMIIDGDELVKADVTYHPSMAATGVSLAVYGTKGISLPGYYQQAVPSKIILAAELITEENAEDYYTPASVF